MCLSRKVTQNVELKRFLDHYFNWEDDSGDKREDAGGRAKMRMLIKVVITKYHRWLDQQYILSEKLSNLCLRTFSGGMGGKGGWIHPWLVSL